MPIFSFNFTQPIIALFKKKAAAKPEPLVIEDELGRFVMENPHREDSYWGDVNLLGRDVSVCLRIDGSGQMTASAALKNLHTFAAHADDWDARIKQFAADDFVDQDGTIETWGGAERDSEIISKEEFMRRIEMNFICFYSDGSIFLDYDLDDMFTDHGLGVDADISGKIESCTLWG